MKKDFINIKYQNFELKVGIFIREKSDQWILCLHGIQSNSELFEKLINQSFLNKYSILCIDNIGFGISSKPDNFSYDIQDQGNIIQKIIEKMEIQKLHIIGHSLGGMIGTLLLNSMKEKVLSFINMEGNLTFADCGLSRTVAAYNCIEFQNIQYNKIKSDLESSKEKSAPDRRKWLEQIPANVFHKTSHSIVDWAKSEKLLQIFLAAPQRKLFIYGDKNLSKATILSPSIECVEIPKAGHFMLHDNFEATAKAIEIFLRKIK